MKLQTRAWLIELRKAKGLTQAQIAKSCGVTRQAVTAWESGKQSPSREAMLTLVDELGSKVMEEFSSEHALRRPVKEAS